MKKVRRLFAFVLFFALLLSVTGAASVPAATGSDNSKENSKEKTEKEDRSPADSTDINEIRILPEILHCDDTLINQVTVPGPDAGDYSLYQPEMFYGRWRVEDEGKNKDRSVTKGMFEEKLTDINGEEQEAEVLPWYIGFGVMDSGSIYKSLPLYLDTATTGYISFGNGTAGTDEIAYTIVYDVSGDTLAFGLIDALRDDVREGNVEDVKVVKEIRYQIVEWTGCRLTLRYGNRELTYVPDTNLKKTNDEYDLVWNNNSMWLSKNSIPFETPYVLTSGSCIFNNGIHGGFSLKSSLTLNNDGTAELTLNEGATVNFGYGNDFGTLKEGRDGKVYAFISESNAIYRQERARLFVADHMSWDYEAYYYSQNAITLRFNGHNLVYLGKADWDNHHLIWDFDAEMLWLPAETENLEGTSFMLKDKLHEENLGYTVGELIELGFETEEDVTKKIESRIVCEVFKMTKDGVDFDVRAVNPYKEEIPLEDCIVCYFGFDDTTGAVTLDGVIGCGKSVRSDITGYYKDPFINKDDHVVYQTSNPARDYENEYGDFVISEDVRTADVLFRFTEDETLEQIVFLAPYLLYNTLAGNLGELDLATLDPDDLDEAERIRDEILAELAEAFEKENVEVAIDTLTGEITLDNKILFGFNRYDLTEEGAGYIDSFLKAYASVLLDGEHKDAVKEVRFDGHTDTVGTYEYNMELSLKRANTVLEYCADGSKAGLSKDQIEAFKETAVAAGHSYSDPVYGADGRIDMDASRRVEINFLLNIGGETGED